MAIISASSSRMFTNYEISDEICRKQVQCLEKKYGGRIRAHTAARTIQRAATCTLAKFNTTKNPKRVPSHTSSKCLDRTIGNCNHKEFVGIPLNAAKDPPRINYVA
uniref:Uncharacterized protein n=1 Tax=Acrobeloides nanus TaxID=290746 RepID=A0A914DI43_9BILA